jgi:hypothetical protein
VSERKAGRKNGIAIGLAIGAILLGLLGWSNAALMYGTLYPIFEDSGLDPSSHFVFRNLNLLISSYQAITVIGAALLVLGILFEWKPGLWGFSGDDTRNRWASGMLGGGGALAGISLMYLFYYLRAMDYLYLQFFVTCASIGLILIVLGIVLYRRKKIS